MQGVLGDFIFHLHLFDVVVVASCYERTWQHVLLAEFGFCAPSRL
jgi:hypothetical protein